MNRIGIDFGTANTIIFKEGKGIVLNEPTVVAISQQANKIIAIGNEAKTMLGRTPNGIIAKRPLKNGAIASYKITEAMMRYFLTKSLGVTKFIKPDVIVSVPTGSTSVEKRAIYEALLSAGARKISLVFEPYLAALGAGMQINESYANMIVNIGGGTTEIAIISLNGIVAWSSERVAGDAFNEYLSQHLKRKFSLNVGEQMSEYIKIQVGSVLPMNKPKTIEARGRDSITGLPKNILINSNDLIDAWRTPLNQIVSTIKKVLEKTPPELSSDIIDRGVVLSGGSANMRGLDFFLTKAIGVPFFIAEDPVFCVAKGTGIIIEEGLNVDNIVRI